MMDHMDDADDDEIEFDCSGYWDESCQRWYCPKAGSEECDMECPYRGV